MKKYCLTKCFKRKLSRGWINTINTTLIIATAIIGLLILAAIFYAIGYIAVNFLWFELPKESSYGELGILLSAVTAVISWFIYWITKAAIYLSKSTTHFIKDRYEGKEFECNIFEECKEEKDTSSEPEI